VESNDCKLTLKTTLQRRWGFKIERQVTPLQLFVRWLDSYNRSVMLSRYAASARGAFSRFVTHASPELFKKGDQLVEDRIRPGIQMDGGDIFLHDIIDNVMVVSMSGACQGCSSKRGTLNYGVLGLVQEEFPEIQGIREKLEFEDL
jgi:Fe-S cluster biogenesis protein NfuA